MSDIKAAQAAEDFGHAPSEARTIIDLADDNGLTPAEAAVALKRAKDNGTDLDAEVVQIKTERVGPAATVENPEPEPWVPGGHVAPPPSQPPEVPLPAGPVNTGLTAAEVAARGGQARAMALEEDINQRLLDLDQREREIAAREAELASIEESYSTASGVTNAEVAPDGTVPADADPSAVPSTEPTPEGDTPPPDSVPPAEGDTP